MHDTIPTSSTPTEDISPLSEKYITYVECLAWKEGYCEAMSEMIDLLQVERAKLDDMKDRVSTFIREGLREGDDLNEMVGVVSRVLETERHIENVRKIVAEVLRRGME
ncbi:uncharacterized protein H6S33_004886 [Morchella sextelata]|uniref:uncharacterized protein n=1 Tax=Morchella sextelata TaxID=1174677 RepID=UPI001D055DB7|nr:uncharacterized protein H6S33_004886 [Morchella sextelata]KAH0605664.1 hypothetical protein H6S33_004886 [Morchella sextelata]